MKTSKALPLLLVLFNISSLLLGQEIKDLEFKEISVVTRVQLQSLEMVPEDRDLIIYDKDRETFMRYTGSTWMDIGDGGDFRSALLENADNIKFRKTMVTKKLRKDSTVKFIPKFDKKARQHLVLNYEYNGLIIYEGEFKIFTNGNWSKLGKGGNFGAMLNRQKSIEGLKEGFMTNWRRAYGFGLHAGLIYPSFFRDEVYPSNPFLNGLSSGWEVGITQNLIYKRFFQSKVHFTYNNIILTEVFKAYDGSALTATWRMKGGKVVLLPIMITPGTEVYKLSIGVGGYGRYHVSKLLESDRPGLITDAEEAIDPLEYGVQAQLGFQLSRFFIEINATNQVNTLIRGDWVKLNQEITKIKLKTFSLNLTFNF